MRTREIAKRRPRGEQLLVIAAALGVAACSDDGKGVAAEPPSESAGSLYALHITTMDVTETYTSYIVLSDSLDLTSVSLDQAHEFPGFASIAAIGGRLLVASGDEPRITSYTATPDLQWREGPSTSFANYGENAGFWNQFFLDEHTAYQTIDITSRVVWDPTTLKIQGVVEDTNLQLERDGLQLEPTVSRQIRPPVPPVLRPFYYHDEDYFQFGGHTPIAVYDPKTHAEAAVIEHLASSNRAGDPPLKPRPSPAVS